MTKKPNKTMRLTSKTKHKSPSPVCSPVDLRQQDDWTKVKDPKEKKKIQNRVAQRTYRHRMKARLHELQSRLESFEASHSQQSDSNCDGCLDSLTKESTKFHGETNDNAAESSVSPRCDAVEDKLSRIDDEAHCKMPTLEISHTYAGIASGDVLGSSRPIHALPILQLLQAAKNQVESYAKKEPEDSAIQILPKTQEYLLPIAYEEATIPNVINEAECYACPLQEARNQYGVTCLEASADLWNHDESIEMQQPLTDGLYLNFMSPDFYTYHTTSMPTSLEYAARASSLAQNPNLAPCSSLEQRFTSILRGVEAAGFETFDSMVAAYYIHAFEECSPLADEQRLSRNLRLPQVISDIFRAATTEWSDWEREGIQNALIHVAGDKILSNEGIDMRQLLSENIVSLIQRQNACSPSAAYHSKNSIKKLVQQTLPNSWALMMALNVEKRHFTPTNFPDTALAATLLLSLSGRIPNGQLLQILGFCLEGISEDTRC